MERIQSSTSVVVIMIVIIVIASVLAIAKAKKAEGPPITRVSASQPINDIPSTSDFTVSSTSVFNNSTARISVIKDNKTSIEYLMFESSNGLFVIKRDGGIYGTPKE